MDVLAWFKKKNNLLGIVGTVIIMIILALDFSYWAANIATASAAEDIVEDVLGENETLNYTLEMANVLDDSGPAGRGSPLGRSTTTVTFTVAEKAKIVTVNLSAEGGNDRCDYDLDVTSPGGQTASSAGPTAEESVTFEAKGNKTLDSGTWEVTIVFYAFTFGTNYHVVADAFYMVEGNETCVGGVCT